MYIESPTPLSIPYLLQGEILGVTAEPVKDFEQQDRAEGYDVLVTFPNGSQTILHNVIQACMFGGLGDYQQSRLRASNDANFKMAKNKDEALKVDTSVGDRVIIAFINGDARKPIVVGHFPHPQRLYDLPDTDNKNTQLKSSYKGFETSVNKIGEVQFTHRGAPGVKDLGNGQEVSVHKPNDIGPKELPAREIKSPIPSPAIKLNKSPKQTDKPLRKKTDNPALSYPDEKYTTESGFLELGEWYVVDSEGQTILLDRDSKTITISNGNDSIQIDKEHKKIFIQSSGDMETTIEKDSVTSITGNKHESIKEDKLSVTLKNEFDSIGGTRTTNITDSDLTRVNNTWKVAIGSAEPIAGGSGKHGGKHLVSFVLSTGNKFTMDDDTIWLIHKTGSLMTLTKEGHVLLAAKDGSMISIDSNAGTVNLVSKTGVVFSVGEKIILAGKSGKEFVSIKDDEVTVASGDAVNINAPIINLNSGNVNLGDKATFSAVNGENLVQWLSQHTHGSSVGPTSPPIILPSVYTSTPLDLLSKSVKVRK